MRPTSTGRSDGVLFVSNPEHGLLSTEKMGNEYWVMGVQEHGALCMGCHSEQKAPSRRRLRIRPRSGTSDH